MPLGSDVRALLVSSGKGGVGKSTVSIGTAMAMVDAGISVGLLDLDVRAPNLTYLLGIPDRCEIDDSGAPVPVAAAPGGRAMAVLSPAMIFRSGGSIITGGNAFRSLVLGLLGATAWPRLDWLVVDMDPAPGDSLRAVRDTVRDVCGVVVTTTDRTSLEDARRMLDAFEGLGVGRAGVVGNMVGLKCHHCGETIVDGGDPAGIEAVAREHGTRVVALLPWDAGLHTRPVEAASGRFAETFRRIARAAVGAASPAAVA
ncbi:MAG: P-loop NTPase [Acidimicrobiales bacterium]